MFPVPSFVVRAVNPSRELRLRLLLAAAWLGSLALVGVLVALAASRVRGDGHSAALDAARTQNDALQARIAMLTRSEQVAKAALGDLQVSLRDRDEEIAGLRADLAFYGRLAGGGKREGLAVHALRVTPVPGSHAWNFTATLTQNFKRGDETRGRLTLSVEGIAGGKLETLGWKALADGENAGGVDYSFKYFQQVRGTMMFPDGFAPNRVVVHAEGDGAHAEQSFAWNDAVKGQESEDVPQ